MIGPREPLGSPFVMDWMHEAARWLLVDATATPFLMGPSTCAAGTGASAHHVDLARSEGRAELMPEV
jgi:hypothetical protein